MNNKILVQGGFGPVPMAENGRRYIDSEPVTVDLDSQFGSYYVRRMMSGELVEWIEEVSITPAGIKIVEEALAKRIAELAGNPIDFAPKVSEK